VGVVIGVEVRRRSDRGRRPLGTVAVLAASGLLGAACVAGGPSGGSGPGSPLPGGPGGAPTACASGSGPGGGDPLPTSPTSVPEIPATTIFGTPERPDPIVAVGTDGAVVTLDPASGERTDELAPAPSAGAVVGVTLSADGATAWFDTCQRDGAGAVYQVPIDGSAPAQRVATGASPEAAPAGDRLAYLAGRSIVVRDLATGVERRWTDTTGGGPLTWLAWVGDGTELVWVRGGTQLVRLDPDAADAQPVAVPGATAGGGEVLYATLGLRGGLATVLVGSGVGDTSPDRLVVTADGAVSRAADGLTGGARDRAWDASSQWGLRADAYGNLRWSVGGGTGLITTGYTAADW
jgi:hypothetical protein